MQMQPILTELRKTQVAINMIMLYVVVNKQKSHHYFPEEIDEQSLLAGSSPEEGPNETRKRDLKSPSESSGGFVPPGLYHAATELGTMDHLQLM